MKIIRNHLITNITKSKKFDALNKKRLTVDDGLVTINDSCLVLKY